MFGRLNQPARVVVASDRLHQPQILCITSHPPPSLRLNQPIVPGDQWPASKFAVILIDLCPPAEPAAGKSTGRNNPPAEPAHRLNQPTACISRFVSSIARRLHRSRILPVIAQTSILDSNTAVRPVCNVRPSTAMGTGCTSHQENNEHRTTN